MTQKREASQGRGTSQFRLVQSVERALTMLEEIAASTEPPSTSEIAGRAGVNRATAWRLLTTLEHFHLVERDPLSGRYTIGYGAVRIAAASDASSLVRVARPVLERLGADLDESVYLQVACGRTMLVLDEVPPTQPIRFELPNLEVPLHCGSANKLFLAYLPEREREEFLAEPLESYTSRTVTDPDRLRAELAQVRAEGFAVAYKEHLPDWGGVTAAACDRRGVPFVYLNVTVPSYRYTEDGLKALAAPLKRAAAELERRLLPAPQDRSQSND